MRIKVGIIPVVMWFHEKGYTIDDNDKMLVLENNDSKSKITYDKEYKTLHVEYVECRQINLDGLKKSKGSFEMKNDGTLIVDKELADKLRELLKCLEE